MEKVFTGLLNMNLTASYVILAVLLVRLAFKKRRKNMHMPYGAWSGFGLAVPFLFNPYSACLNSGYLMYLRNRHQAVE